MTPKYQSSRLLNVFALNVLLSQGIVINLTY